jgi:hypothetical protein
MKCVLTVPEDMVGILHPYLPTNAGISLVIDACDQKPLIIPKVQDPKLFKVL